MAETARVDQLKRDKAVSNNGPPSLIETECAAIVELLRINWQDSQSIEDWKRIAFQLNGAGIISRKNQPALAVELEFLSSLAFNRVYIMEKRALDEVIAFNQAQRSTP